MLEEKDLPEFINSLDIYVHATLGETMSTAIMQVMACRVPVIASDVPGVNNMIIHEQLGLLVPVKNETAMAEAIVYLLDHPEVAAKLSGNAFDFAITHYSNTSMLDKYKAVFKGQ
jgi:L-malate glycosyltransferase